MEPRNDSPPRRLRGLPSWLLSQNATYAGRLVTDALANSGMRRYHYSLLAALEEFGPSSQAELGRHCRIDRSDMVTAINEMVAWELVDRGIDPNNPRRNIITPTTKGERRLHALEHALGDAQEKLLAPLTTTQRTQLVDLLGRILDYHRPAQ